MEDYWIERGGGKEKRQKYSKLEFKVLLLCLWEGKLENPLKYPPPPLLPWSKDGDQEKNLGIKPGPQGGEHSQPKPRFS